ncbi:MAG: hypothetical protein O3C46_00780 [Bacteroidetes bacterium]|nr:hypothetical protein [Bacteroidota bacterium]MDA0930174.1 hypothetical protein [Bacteroidota bacterium]
MKSLITIISIVFLSQIMMGQGTLQFNQAILLEGNQSNCSTCWTVPAGKTWKVGSASTSTSSSFHFFVNNRQLGLISGPNTSTTDARFANAFPFWLPAGSTLGYVGLSSGHNVTFFALEFNVIP